jgi:hypothetical protein
VEQAAPENAMKRRILYLASTSLAFLAGCERGGVSDYTGYAADYMAYEDPVDDDDDGWEDWEDCDDGDPAINPDADEICDDGIDNDCDELTDADDTEDCG